MKKRWMCAVLAAVIFLSVLSAFPIKVSAVEEMKISQSLVDVVKKMEGFDKYPYWDYSQWSVGYGSECPDDKLEEYKENGITEEEAEKLLRNDLTRHEAAVNKYARTYDIEFLQHQFDALVSFSFNCGSNWTRDTNSELHHTIMDGELGHRFVYALSLYSKPHTDYLLIKRRLTEANMYINGVYKAYNKDKDAYPTNYKWVFLDGNGGEVIYGIHGYDAKENPGIATGFSKIPTGVDENGNVFIYEFAGWYTARVGGSKIETLDGTLSNATVLYAQWKNPTGQIVPLPKGEVNQPLEIKVKSKTNIWNGTGTYYTKLGILESGMTATITEVYVSESGTWGKYEAGWINLANTNYKEVLASQEMEKEWPRTGKVTGSNVNVRSGPGTNHEVQYQLNKGDKVLISESYDDGELVWGKMEDGNWICLSYVELDPYVVEETPPIVTGISILQPPKKTDYVQMQDDLQLEGSILQVNYSDGSLAALTLERSMISRFTNAELGQTTVVVSYLNQLTSFTVNIVKATVTFLHEDGTVLSIAQYAYGEAVVLPPTPEKPADEAGSYVFAGWDKEVTLCAGDAVYTAVFVLGEEPSDPEYIPGDLDGSGTVDEYDADHLLGYLLFPDWYPVNCPADLDGDGVVDENDADYLLGYLLFPDWYPLCVDEP